MNEPHHPAKGSSAVTELDLSALAACVESSSAPRAPKPLRAFYGASDRQKHNATVESMISPGERPQEILTPLPLLAPLLADWGEIALDPCACDTSLVPALVKYYGPPRDAGGLILPWLDRTYCNPPFKHLALWLLRAQNQREKTGGRIAVLAPVRTHRKWFRVALDSAQRDGSVKWLDPVKFVGYDQTFPAPLCLLRWG